VTAASPAPQASGLILHRVILPRRNNPALVIPNPEVEIVAPTRRLVLMLVVVQLLKIRRININDINRLVYRWAVIVVDVHISPHLPRLGRQSKLGICGRGSGGDIDTVWMDIRGVGTGMRSLGTHRIRTAP